MQPTANPNQAFPVQPTANLIFGRLDTLFALQAIAFTLKTVVHK